MYDILLLFVSKNARIISGIGLFSLNEKRIKLVMDR